MTINDSGVRWANRSLWVKDADPAVRRVIEEIFRQFQILGSSGKIVKWLRTHGLRLPSRYQGADHSWVEPRRSRVHQILTNPVYAGYYVLRVSPKKKHRSGTGLDLLASPDAIVVANHHESYVSQEQWLQIQQRLANQRISVRQPAGKGPALCQGLICCGECGRRMSAQYYQLVRTTGIRYKCRPYNADYGVPPCLTVLGRPIDDVVVREILASLTAPSIEAVIAAATELNIDHEAALHQREAALQRAHYAAHVTKERFQRVDPANRLVAATLEKDLENALLAVQAIERQHACAPLIPLLQPTPEVLAAIRQLADDLPTLWGATSTTHADRKAIVRLLMKKILITELDPLHLSLDIEWIGGPITRYSVFRPLAGSARIRQMDVQGLKPKEIVAELNRLGIRKMRGGPYTPGSVRAVLNSAPQKTGGRPWGAYREKLREPIKQLAEARMSDQAIAEELNARGLRPRVALRWTRDSVSRLRRILGIATGLDPRKRIIPKRPGPTSPTRREP